MTSHTDNKAGSRSSTTDRAADEAKSIKDDVVQKAGEARDAAIDAAQSTAEGAKKGVADELSSIGTALRRAADEMRDGSPQERTFGQMAGTLADLSDNVRGKDLGEMVDDLAGFARRNPVAFLGGAALLGFAGVRMAKASQRARDDDDHDDFDHVSTASRSGIPAPATRPVQSPLVAGTPKSGVRS